MPQRLVATRQRQELGKELRRTLRQQLRAGEVEPLSYHDVPADRLTITMRDAKFSYHDYEAQQEQKEQQQEQSNYNNKLAARSGNRHPGREGERRQ